MLISDNRLENPYNLFNKCKNDNEVIWIKAFYNYINRERANINLERAKKILDEFFINSINFEGAKSNFADDESPILICVVKNEIERIKYFYRHYRKSGIRKFAMIDNSSSDGTYEWMRDQQDTDLYRAVNEYSSAGRVAWINKILSIYGYNRWYAIVDADEFLDYAGSEKKEIAGLIKQAEKNKLFRVAGLQIDMYSENPLFSKKGARLDLDECIFFDNNSYERRESEKCDLIVGGPRKRVLDTYSVLTKYPLFYYRNEDLYISSHYFYPYKDNFLSKFHIAILHYEFINENDLNKVRSIAEKQNYASNSNEHRHMLEVINNNVALSFMHEGAVKYRSSSDIKQISFMAEMPHK